MISSTDPLFILPLFIKREKKKTEVLNPQGGKKKKTMKNYWKQSSGLHRGLF